MKLLAVDGNSLVNRAFYGIRLLSTKDGTYTNAIMGFLNMLLKIQDEVEPEAVAIAFDMSGPTFRHEMYDGYKAQRTGMPDELAQQMPILQELLQALGYTIVMKKGWEADDIIGTLTRACKEQGHQCIIATGDRDSYQLVDDQVSVHLAYTRRGQTQEDIVTPAFIKEEYGGLTPHQLIDMKALMGDPSDNIPGVRGVGEKTALALLQEFDSLDYIYDNFEDIDLRPGVRRNLEAGKEDAYLSRELSIIDQHAPIDTDVSHYLKEKPDDEQAYPLMTRLELFRQMERLGVQAPVGTELEDFHTEKAPLKVTLGTIPTDYFTGETPLDVLFEISEKDFTLSGICVIDGNHLVYQAHDVDAAAQELLTSPRPLRTNQLKPLWRWAILQDIAIENVVLDAEIAAYILNPNANNYQLDRLYREHSILPDAADPELVEEYPLLELAPGFTLLCDVLEKEIKDNDQQHLLHDIELPLAHVLAHMEHVGIAADKAGIHAFGEAIQGDLDRAEQSIYEYAGREFNVNSPMQLSQVLFEDLELPPGRKTKTGYSTNADVLEGLKDKHPIIGEVLEYRQLAKLKSTYVDGLTAVIQEDGRIHTTFQQTLTRTGRISSTEPNLQNIPVRTPLGSELRRYFQAAEGYTFLDADYSQIELRVLAHLSEDSHMIEAFQQEQDIHTRTAAQVLDMPEALITPAMRDRAKAVNFGIVYGIGAFSLSQDIGVTVAEADEYIKNYLHYYSGVDRYMEDIIESGKEKGYVETMFHRRRYLPELTSKNYNMRAFGQRVARNMPIQGTAADIIKIAMIRVFHRLKEEGLTARLVLQVHDELIVECPPEEAEQASKILQEEMENATALKVPLVAEVKSGPNWLEVK